MTHIFALALTVSEILKFFICYLQKVGNGYGVHFRNNTIRWQMSYSTNVSHFFASTAFQRFNKKLDFYFGKKVGCYGMQFWRQLYHSMENV